MIEVRDVFQAKFGKIDQAVALFSRLQKMSSPYATSGLHYHVLTDISGPMYILVTEMVVPGLGEWETIRDKSFNQPGFGDWFKEFQLIIDGGRREFYTIEGDCEDWSGPGLVVDLAADFRVQDLRLYQHYYGSHPAPELVGRFRYGLADIAGPKLAGAAAIAAPGCFATAAQLALYPLARVGLDVTPSLFAVTGSSGYRSSASSASTRSASAGRHTVTAVPTSYSSTSPELATSACTRSPPGRLRSTCVVEPR